MQKIRRSLSEVSGKLFFCVFFIFRPRDLAISKFSTQIHIESKLFYFFVINQKFLQSTNSCKCTGWQKLKVNPHKGRKQKKESKRKRAKERKDQKKYDKCGRSL